MNHQLSKDELVALVRRVFEPKPEDTQLGILVDLPDTTIADNATWQGRRNMAAQWATALNARSDELGLRTHLILYQNAHTNNGDLPESCWLHENGDLPDSTEKLDAATSKAFSTVFSEYPILIAPTEFSATAPLKMAAKKYPIRAATMPGFSEEMIPALRLDYTSIAARVNFLKGLLDRAQKAMFCFRHGTHRSELQLDLRHRQGHSSGGLLPKPGMAGNLPSGEAYVVPYEGEKEGQPSLSHGELPVQFGPEIVRYRIEENKAVEVLSDGPISAQEKELLGKEPVYGNLAELGLGVLGDYGIKPVGQVLLDEKLGPHIAFGRSDHFGGQVGPGHFSSSDAVVHIDRVYVPEMQPDVRVLSLDLVMDDETRLPLIQDGKFVVDFHN